MDANTNSEWDGKIKKNYLSHSDLEEFEEFEKKVDEVNALIQLMAAGGSPENIKPSFLEFEGKADGSLTEDSESKSAEPTKTLKKRHSTNSINRTTIKSEESLKPPSLTELNSETMSQEAFMKAVEEDANKRHKDRIERNKKADHLMVEGNECFRNGKFEKALSFYNEAIDVRRDSSLLYTNRAVTLLRLGLYTRACKDCESSLNLKENLKPRLYKGRALFEMGDVDASIKWMDETREMYPNRISTIEEYEVQWQKNK